MFFPKQLRRNSRTFSPFFRRPPLELRANPTQSFRIATYNIHKGVSALSRRNRIHDLRRSLHSLDAGIVFLQEVQGRNDRHAERFSNWPTSAQHDYLASSVWEHSVYGRNAVRADGDHGNALLSRYALIGSENLDVSDHRFESRGLLHCELDILGRRVHCLCAHFGLFEDSRKRQAQALIDRIRTTVPDDAPLIIAGDFNDWRNRLGATLSSGLGVSEVFELLRAGDERRQGVAAGSPSFSRDIANLARARFGFSPSERRISARIHPARTFPAVFPVLRLDRIYVRGLDVRQAVVVHGSGWKKLSDHAPIVADLCFRD